MKNDLGAAVSDSGGAGPVLVFLHGFCESKKIWDDFTRPLRATYRVVLVDLPGFGDHPASGTDYSMEHGAAYVRQVLEALQVRACILVGHSMGGYVALAFAEKYPEMLQGLVLFHSTAFADSEEKKENRNRTVQFIQKHGVGKFMDTFVAPLFFEGNREQHQAAIALLTQLGKDTAEAAILGALTAMRDRPDRSAVLRHLTCPVLIIAGKQDPAVPLEQTLQQCHLAAEAQVLFLDQCGHMGMFEKPRETLAALQGFTLRWTLTEEAPALPDIMG